MAGDVWRYDTVVNQPEVESVLSEYPGVQQLPGNLPSCVSLLAFIVRFEAGYVGWKSVFQT